MAKHLYHAPADCPVCGVQLITTRKGCLKCGTEIAGEFASCDFCALPEADLELLKLFIASRGNVREVEKQLGVSYPTARARIDALIAKLGLTATAQEGGAPSAPEPSQGSAQDQILARVARGEISPEVAAQLLG